MPPRSATAAGPSSPPIPAGLTPEQIGELYYWLLFTRMFEERLTNLYRQGKVIGGLFRSLGQEGESVASAYALRREDFLSPLIRNLGSMLVKGAEPLAVVRQYMAKAESPTKGRELNIHFGDLEKGYVGQISHLGDMVPVMAGVALTFKMRKEKRVVLVYCGDGATSTGAFHEGINFAAVQKLPMVVIVENNGWAYSTRTEKQTAVKQLVDKARGYGIPGERCDGNDVLAVYEVTRRAVERARGGGGVTLLEFVTYRRKGHAEHDDQGYQPKEEIASWASTNDPIDRFEKQLDETGWLSREERAAIRERIDRELTEIVTKAENEPFPAAESALEDVYADPARIPELWYRPTTPDSRPTTHDA